MVYVHKGLPLEVLGLMCPLLAYVEGGVRGSLPEHWALVSKNMADRQREWLRRELPSYSYDNMDDIIAIALNPMRKAHHVKWDRDLVRHAQSALAPPNGYDLVDALRKLAFHYFEWNNNTLFVRDGLLVELHELAMRFPVRHLIRYAQVEAVVRGYLPMEDTQYKSAQMDDLHTVYSGMRGALGKGLVEGHLHLSGILTPDETWADHLFSRHSAACFTGEELRLLTLGRRSVQLLATGILLNLIPAYSMDDRSANLIYPFQLIELLDRIYHAKSRHEVSDYAKIFDNLFSQFKDHLFKIENGSITEAENQDDKSEVENQDDKSAAENQDDKPEAENQDDKPEADNPDDKSEAENQDDISDDGNYTPPSLNPGVLEQILHEKDVRKLEWLLPLISPRGTPSLGQGVSPARPSMAGSTGMRRHIEVLGLLHFHTQHLLMSRDSLVAWRGHERAEFQVGMDQNKLKRGQESPLRKWVHDVFFRYLIYQGHHWQRATQSGNTTGLRHFVKIRRARQRKPITDPLEGYGMAFERMSSQSAVKRVEGRISPPRRLSEVIPWILAYNNYRDKTSLEQFGMVVHFIKDPQPFPTSKSGAYREVRFASIRRHSQREAFRLFRLLSTANPVSPFIVGIDAAHLELAVPPEVFAPAFRFLRDYPVSLRHSEGAVRNLDKHRGFFNQFKERRLGLTYHVGEDFRHLLSGLRAIDEVLEFLNPIPGDRLGHATALAVSAENWAAHTGYQAVLSKQEWLDTLVWLHHHLGEGHPLLAELKILDRIQRLSRQVYGASNPKFDQETRQIYGRRRSDLPSHRTELDDGWSIPTLYDSWRLRQMDPYCAELKDLVCFNLFTVRNRIGQGLETRRWLDIQTEVLDRVNQFVGSNAAYRLLGLYWYNAQVKEIGDQIIKLDMFKDRDIWIEACVLAQEKLRAKVSRKQLVVETNPSSNRLIGPINSFAEHYIFALTLDKNRQPTRDIRVTVNTDNPGVSATSLTHEYYLLGEILLEEGMPEPRVIEWLEWLRDNGESYTFLNLMPDMNTDAAAAFMAEIKHRYRYLNYRVSGKPAAFVPDYRELDQMIRSERQVQKAKLSQMGRQVLEQIHNIEKDLAEKDQEIMSLKDKLAQLMGEQNESEQD